MTLSPPQPKSLSASAESSSSGCVQLSWPISLLWLRRTAPSRTNVTAHAGSVVLTAVLVWTSLDWTRVTTTVLRACDRASQPVCVLCRTARNSTMAFPYTLIPGSYVSSFLAAVHPLALLFAVSSRPTTCASPCTYTTRCNCHRLGHVHR